MGFIHLYIFISNLSKRYISVLESFSFEETAILFVVKYGYFWN